MLSQRLLLGIIIGAGVFSVGLSYGTLTQSASTPDSFDHAVKMQNGKYLFWMDNSTAIGRTGTGGINNGGTLTLKGYTTIIYRIGASADGTTSQGTEAFRIDAGGLNVPFGESQEFTNNLVSIARTSSVGDISGSNNYLNERGYSGIVFRTGGTTAFGTGTEIARFTSTGLGIGTNAPTEMLDVNGKIHLTGNITATPATEFAIITTNSKDICIGNGC